MSELEASHPDLAWQFRGIREQIDYPQRDSIVEQPVTSADHNGQRRALLKVSMTYGYCEKLVIDFEDRMIDAQDQSLLLLLSLQARRDEAKRQGE